MNGPTPVEESASHPRPASLPASFSQPLWPDGAPGSEEWHQVENVVDARGSFPHRLEYNVSQPRIDVHLPAPGTDTGDVVVVLPGGAFHFLAVDHEGTEVAEWLAARGTTGVVCHYRVCATPDDEEDFHAFRDRMGFDTSWRDSVPALAPLAVADAGQAVATVRRLAGEWGVRADRVGVLGFSAGGGVALGSSQLARPERPDFIADIYGVAPEGMEVDVTSPPLFALAAADDDVVPVDNVLRAYTLWLAAGQNPELHLYSRGGHGFGMHAQGLPVDRWIEDFAAWLDTPVHP